jgi:hypothetical protein
MTPNGQIARLPPGLQNGELAQDLLSWLNQLPDVQPILAAKPIDESSLTCWKQGGYLEKETEAPSPSPWRRCRVRPRRRPGEPAYRRDPNLIEPN